MNKNKFDIIKIGGSVITDKLSYKKLNSDSLNSISEVIAKWGHKSIIVHGAGSFGHILAEKHSITSGFTEFSQLDGIVQIRLDMTDLTKKVVESLQNNKLQAVSFQTSSIVYSQGTENKLNYFIEPIQKALDLGLLPVLSGDVIFKQEKGFSIYSGDALIDLLVQLFDIRNVYFISDVDGLFVRDSDTHKMELVERIESKQLSTIELSDFSDKKTIDVTGKMKGKIDDIKSISQHVERVVIVNGSYPERISLLLSGDKAICTTIIGEKST